MPEDKKKPKVLIMTEWFVPGFRAGGPIKSMATFCENMNDHLDIYVLTTNKDLGEQKPYPHVQTNKWVEVYEKGYSVNYMDGYNVFSIYSQIIKIQPDYIYLNSMYSFYFSFFIVILKYMGLIQPQIILAPRGMLQAGALKYKPRKKKVFRKLFERLKVSRHVIFHATDDKEYQDIKRYFPSSKSIFSIPNFLSAQPPSNAKIEKQKGLAKLLYVSRIVPKKNLMFFLNLLKSIDQGVHLTIVGPIEDDKYFKKCEALIQELPTNISIKFLGGLPFELIASQLNSHHFFVLPSFGENFGHAIFEALSFGRPVLISNKTPLKNLSSNQTGWDIDLDEWDRWHDTIRKMIEMDQSTYDKWSKSASDFARLQFNSYPLKSRYMELFSS